MRPNKDKGNYRGLKKAETKEMACLPGLACPPQTERALSLKIHGGFLVIAIATSSYGPENLDQKMSSYSSKRVLNYIVYSSTVFAGNISRFSPLVTNGRSGQ